MDQQKTDRTRRWRQRRGNRDVKRCTGTVSLSAGHTNSSGSCGAGVVGQAPWARHWLRLRPLLARDPGGNFGSCQPPCLTQHVRRAPPEIPPSVAVDFLRATSNSP